MAASVGVLGARPRVPVVVHRTYGLPSWAPSAGALIIAVTYSGETEEVLSGIVEAVASNLPVAGVTSGGAAAAALSQAQRPVVLVPADRQPRAALGYLTGAVLQLLGGAEAAFDVSAQLEEAAAVLDELLQDGDGVAISLGSDLAAGLERRLAVIYGGSGPGALAAYRWKTQINETARMPAYAGEVPELNHNELDGWSTLPALTSRVLGLVLLRDRVDHARVARRLDLTEEVLAGRIAKVGTVFSMGEGPLARFFSLAVVGDVASELMAERGSVDPTPVPLLEDFKVRLREE